MKITGFNEVTINSVKHNLGKKRIEIIENERNRIREFDYDGVSLNIGQALSNHLSQLRFEIVGNQIKLGEVYFSVVVVNTHEYNFDGKLIVGTIEEIKEKVTKLIEEYDPIINNSIWICGNLFNGGDRRLSSIKTFFINSEMEKYENYWI